MRRRRNSFLRTLELFRDVNPAFVVTDLIVFMYICENEGLTIKELAGVARLTEATASRRARLLGTEETLGVLPEGAGLIELLSCPADGRARLLYLTEPGRVLRDQIADLISQARPIAAPLV